MSDAEILEKARFFERAKRLALDALGPLGPRSAASLFISELQRHPELRGDDRYWALTWMEVTQLVLPGGAPAVRAWIQDYSWPKPLAG